MHVDPPQVGLDHAAEGLQGAIAPLLSRPYSQEN